LFVTALPAKLFQYRLSIKKTSTFNRGGFFYRERIRFSGTGLNRVELIRHWKKIYACNGFSTGLLRLKTGGDGKSKMYS